MDVFGDLKIVPDDEFRLILDYLSFQDVGNLRCVSKRIKGRITLLLKSKFNKFFIKIDSISCNEISETLFHALAETYAPEKLELKICFKLNLRMRQILQDSSELVTSLVINVRGNEELLLQPGFRFENLERLEINDYDENDEKCYDEDYYNTKASVVEAMLAKHANSLKILTIKDLEKNITVPTLPKLDSLTLLVVGEDPACNLLEQTRHTITSLEIDHVVLHDVDLAPTPLTNFESTDYAIYEIQNLKHLKIESIDFKFMLRNAEHLASLEINKFHMFIGIDIEWPQLPNLKELALSFAAERSLPILMKCRNTLELLLVNICSDYHIDVVMPKLTDLYISGGRGVKEHTNKIFSSNYKSLEYLFLKDLEIPNLDDAIRMERVKVVVLKSGNSGIYDVEYSDKDRDIMAVICPNAHVVLWNEQNKNEIMNQVKERCKRRNFLIDLTRILESDYWDRW